MPPAKRPDDAQNALAGRAGAQAQQSNSDLQLTPSQRAFDHAMMGIALRMARRGLGRTAPNPSVGAVIADEVTGEVISRACTAPTGRPHAEPLAIAAAIDRFNAINRVQAASRGTHWVDVTGPSREAGRSLLVEDGLHPSAAQYALWVDRVLPVAAAILAARET